MISKRFLSGVLVSGLLVASSVSFPVSAQTLPSDIVVTQAQKGSAVPRQGGVSKLPWERDLKKYYQRRDRLIRGPSATPVPRIRKPTYDPYRVLGIKRNRPVGLDGNSENAAVDPTFDPYVAGIDSNGDSAVSREEYFRKRLRYGAARSRQPGRSSRHIRRLGQQFRSADLNKDGRITAQELQASGQSRF